MQTNYVMEYLTDYNENDNAKIIKIKFVFQVYFQVLYVHERLSFFYFNDIYTNNVMESLNNMI